jgi:pimeloyl-ACP methyl ester carboxylesterase
VTPELLRRAVGKAAVVLPGTGSDEVFVRAVFEDPVTQSGLRLIAPAPVHGARLAEHGLAALDAEADRYGRIVVGGISLGAHLAAEWAAANPDRCAGLLLAMPAWSGPPDAPLSGDTALGDMAPAAVAARISADAIAEHGVDTALAAVTRDVPDWLAAELGRAWRRAGAGLVESLRVAVRRPAPTTALLRRITAPACVVGCVGDPVHPVAVARRWASALPAGTLRTITFGELGSDRSALGRAAVDGLLRHG